MQMCIPLVLKPHQPDEIITNIGMNIHVEYECVSVLCSCVKEEVTCVRQDPVEIS